jgi:2-amino-4-hydroxy-6-hydroxymethyldihydropteridine diphosphokinase
LIRFNRIVNRAKPAAMRHIYLIALGSNRRHHRIGGPRNVVQEAQAHLAKLGAVLTAAAIINSAPIGPSRRTYANGAVVVESDLAPRAMLAALKAIERAFGRRRGQAWSARVLDLDIILWSGGIFAEPDLFIPHRLFRIRDFVLKPAAAIAPDWRDPVTGLSVRHLAHRSRARLGKAQG